ncbi:MAG: MFS transporter [Vulcanimicrobiaceae bacterium]
MTLVLMARGLRNAAYGWLSVVLAVTLAERGLAPGTVGFILSVALVAGAITSLGSGPLVGRFGRTSVLFAAAVAMAVSGALLALAEQPALFAFAALLGTISPGGQEVGPFGAVEQAAIAEDDRGTMTQRFATYNIVGAFATAGGALIAAIVPTQALLWAYGGVGLALAALYAATFADAPVITRALPPSRDTFLNKTRKLGIVERLTFLFGIDALAGGFVVQSFVAYWLHVRFGVDAHVLGVLFFATNVLNALSLIVAARLAKIFGLLETMVFTHLPSSIFLVLVPLAPSFTLAAVALLARAAISQMDVPTRQAYTMALVPPDDRTRAAGMTAAVRPAAAAVAPLLAGLAVGNAAFALPFYIAGGLKIAYDLVLFATFRRVAIVPERNA